MLYKREESKKLWILQSCNQQENQRVITDSTTLSETFELKSFQRNTEVVEQ